MSAKIIIDINDTPSGLSFSVEGQAHQPVAANEERAGLLLIQKVQLLVLQMENSSEFKRG